MGYMLKTRDYCDRTQQHVNSNLYSLVYVWCLFNKAATFFDPEGFVMWQLEQISIYFLFVLLL